MNKLFSSLLLASALSSSLALADGDDSVRINALNPTTEVSLRHLPEALSKVVSKVEVYYSNSENNKQKLQDLNFSAKVFAYETCEFEDLGWRRNRSECIDRNDGYLRVGSLDIGGIAAITGHESSGSLNKATLTLFEGALDGGTYFHILRVGYVKDNRSQILDFSIPVSAGSIGQNVDIKITNDGILKLYFNAEIEAGLGYYDLQDSMNHPDGRNSGFLAFAKANGRSGFKLLERIAVGGMGGVEVQEPGIFSSIYGLEGRIQITNNLSLNTNLTVTNRNVYNKNFRDEVTGKRVAGEKIYQFTGGLRLDF